MRIAAFWLLKSCPSSFIPGYPLLYSFYFLTGDYFDGNKTKNTRDKLAEDWPEEKVPFRKKPSQYSWDDIDTVAAYLVDKGAKLPEMLVKIFDARKGL